MRPDVTVSTYICQTTSETLKIVLYCVRDELPLQVSVCEEAPGDRHATSRREVEPTETSAIFVPTITMDQPNVLVRTAGAGGQGVV